MNSSHTTRSVRRLLSLTAASAMIIATVPGAAFADHRDPQQDVCPPPPGYDEQSVDFSDHEGTTHENNIECVARYGIAQGFADNTYRPNVDVSRAQMATYIANLVRTSGAELPEGNNEFGDDNGNTHEANIDAIAAAGIVLGTGDNNYSPEQSVQRGQMATYIANAIDFADDGEVNGSQPPTATEDHFADDDTNTHHDNINRIAEQHIVLGVDDESYEPNEFTTRGQMATFIMNAADYLEAIGEWNPVVGATDITAQSVEPALVAPGDTTAVTFETDAAGTFTILVNGESVETGAVTTGGVYTIEVTAPSTEGIFDVTLQLVDALGATHEDVLEAALTVNALQSEAAQAEAEAVAIAEADRQVTTESSGEFAYRVAYNDFLVSEADRVLSVENGDVYNVTDPSGPDELYLDQGPRYEDATVTVYYGFDTSGDGEVDSWESITVEYDAQGNVATIGGVAV